MRYSKTVVCAFSLVAGFAACTKDRANKSEQAEVSPEKQAMEQRRNAALGTQQAVQQFEQAKKDYMTKATDDLNKLEAQIATYKAQAPADENARAQHESGVQNLQSQLGDARTKLDQLRDASPEDWSTRQREVEQSILMTRAAYDATVAHTAH